jgi:hypothetical protein
VRRDGISLADCLMDAVIGNAMRTDRRDSVQMTRSIMLPGLRPPERKVLRSWLRKARADGIDAIEDLASRPWPGIRADTILGVYRIGRSHASWLIVGNANGWAVASLDDASVSNRFSTLAAALAAIRPIDATRHPRRQPHLH